MVDVNVAMAGNNAADELRSLRAWLIEEDQLRGRVQLVADAPEHGTLGPDVQALVVALGPGGAVAVLAGGLVAWLRQRTSDVRITVRRDAGHVSVEMSVEGLHRLNDAGLRRLISDLEHVLGAHLGATGTGEDRAGGG
jgi:hypothetical protein